MGWWQSAFAVRPSQPWIPTADEEALVDRIAEAIVRREMTAPALIGLEMCRPLNYVGSQSLHVLMPIMSPFVDAATTTLLAQLLEHREAIELICERINRCESDQNRTANDSKPADCTEHQPG
ncbi:MAG: hypothetical protein O2955_12790 [Planctomycetota bacterium]|nr:hypothetical protein [Planctomycetota bacterium]MDA1213385.1 hypothetical protein [Planctomycetota bacterium]